MTCMTDEEYWRAAALTMKAERDAARAELAKAVRDINTFVNALDEAEARLAAVIALCDSDRYGDAGSMFATDIRATAEGTDR